MYDVRRCQITVPDTGYGRIDRPPVDRGDRVQLQGYARTWARVSARSLADLYITDEKRSW